MAGVRQVLFLTAIATSESLQLRGDESPDGCKDTSKAESFYSYIMDDGAPSNGKRVGEWRDLYPDWRFMMQDSSASRQSSAHEDTTCMLKGDKMDADKGGSQVVLDYSTSNEVQCCKSGDRFPKIEFEPFKANLASHNVSFETFLFNIPAGKDHPEKKYRYDLSIPGSCLPGGAKAPCPLFVSLHGSAGDHLAHQVLECSHCLDELNVVVLMPIIPISEHLDFNITWDAAMWLGEDFVRPVTEEVLEKYSASIDTERVYVFGLSVGGAGAIMDSITEPDLFSVAYAVSPTTIVRGSTDLLARSAEEWKPLYSKRKRSSRLKQIFTYQGGEDMNGPEIDWDYLPQTISSAGVEKNVYVEYRVFPELAHDCWNAAFNLASDRLWKGE